MSLQKDWIIGITKQSLKDDLHKMTLETVARKDSFPRYHRTGSQQNSMEQQIYLIDKDIRQISENRISTELNGDHGSMQSKRLIGT